jgi:hypothetical protein
MLISRSSIFAAMRELVLDLRRGVFVLGVDE